MTGCPKRLHCMNDSGCSIARKCKESGAYYVNERNGSKYKMKFVDPNNVYELCRTYRQSKFNDTFVQMIVTARRVNEIAPLQYFLMSYKWSDGISKEFHVARHGNARSPHAPIYNKQSSQTKLTVLEKLSTGISTGKTYRDTIREASVSYFAIQNF